MGSQSGWRGGGLAWGIECPPVQHHGLVLDKLPWVTCIRLLVDLVDVAPHMGVQAGVLAARLRQLLVRHRVPARHRLFGVQ